MESSAFRVVHVDDVQGDVMIAARPIVRKELIFSHASNLFVVSSGDRDVDAKTLTQVVSHKAAPDFLASWKKGFLCKTFGFDEAVKKCMFSRFARHDDTGQKEGVVFLSEISFCNHSCVPNCCVLQRHNDDDDDDDVFELRALYDIPCNEPLLISYTDETETDKDKRKKKLFQSFGFECSCPRCERPWATSLEEKAMIGAARAIQWAKE